MKYFKNTNNQYLVSVSTNTGKEEISKSEYYNILEIFNTIPEAPEGYTNKLRADTLEWELAELPNPEPSDEDAEISDYENALSEMGVDFSD